MAADRYVTAIAVDDAAPTTGCVNVCMSGTFGTVLFTVEETCNPGVDCSMSIPVGGGATVPGTYPRSAANDSTTRSSATAAFNWVTSGESSHVALNCSHASICEET